MTDDARHRTQKTETGGRTDDSALLRRYAGIRDEDAFAELVRRHLGLVYHAALRQCGGDAHRAEDVAQAVFTDLARQAARLARRPVLAGWLYTSTRYAAAQAVRGEVRRQAREQEAHAMNEIFSNPESPAASAVEWERLRPVIDDALHALGERDREAVLLRFFEGRAFADVGAKLFLSEDAARMRVERALEKLRVSLVRRGVTSTAAALGLALANQAAAAAPAALAASVTGAALASAAAGGGAAAVATFMSMTKLKIGIAVAVLAAGAASLVVQQRTNARLQNEVGALRDQNRELAQVRAENERLASARSDDAAELTSLRAEISAAKNMPAAPAGAPTVDSNLPGKPRLAPGLKPAAQFARGDRTTPQAALETIFSATNDGDNTTLAGALLLLPAARQKAEEMFASLPDAKRAEYGTPEQMLALLLAGSTPVAAMQVTSARPGAVVGVDFDATLANDPAYETLHVQRQYADGRVREQDMVFQQTATGWSWVPPTGIISKVSEMLKPVPANLAHDGGPPVVKMK